MKRLSSEAHPPPISRYRIVKASVIAFIFIITTHLYFLLFLNFSRGCLICSSLDLPVLSYTLKNFIGGSIPTR